MNRNRLFGEMVKPDREQLETARGRPVPDVIARNLAVLFAGINPGLYSGATGHHFARPGNRFWPLLYAAGFTPEMFAPFDEQKLLDLGYGITNIVNRSTASAAELSVEELRDGGQRLRQKVLEFSPRFLAVLGIGAFRKACAQPGAVTGPQQEKIHSTSVWVLPNPSGANANYQFTDLRKIFGELREAVSRTMSL